MRKFLLILSVCLIMLSVPLIALTICPLNKLNTQIAIDYENHPRNIALGITTDTIAVTTTLDVVDPNTGALTPLANQQVLYEISIGNVFAVENNVTGTFSSTTNETFSTFMMTTDANGMINMTIPTDDLVPDQSTINPTQIGYSITASYVPGPKEALIGTQKTVTYTPGSFPLISLAACFPFFLILGLLVAAMFAAGKNPFGMLDFSRVAFRAPQLRNKAIKGRMFTAPSFVSAVAAVTAKKTVSGAYNLTGRTIKGIGNLITKGGQKLSGGNANTTVKAAALKGNVASATAKSGVVGKTTKGLATGTGKVISSIGMAIAGIGVGMSLSQRSSLKTKKELQTEAKLRADAKAALTTKGATAAAKELKSKTSGGKAWEAGLSVGTLGVAGAVGAVGGIGKIIKPSAYKQERQPDLFTKAGWKQFFSEFGTEAKSAFIGSLSSGFGGFSVWSISYQRGWQPPRPSGKYNEKEQGEIKSSVDSKIHLSEGEKKERNEKAYVELLGAVTSLNRFGNREITIDGKEMTVNDALYNVARGQVSDKALLMALNDVEGVKGGKIGLTAQRKELLSALSQEINRNNMIKLLDRAFTSGGKESQTLIKGEVKDNFSAENKKLVGAITDAVLGEVKSYNNSVVNERGVTAETKLREAKILGLNEPVETQLTSKLNDKNANPIDFEKTKVAIHGSEVSLKDAISGVMEGSISIGEFNTAVGATRGKGPVGLTVENADNIMKATSKAHEDYARYLEEKISPKGEISLTSEDIVRAVGQKGMDIKALEPFIKESFKPEEAERICGLFHHPDLIYNIQQGNTDAVLEEMKKVKDPVEQYVLLNQINGLAMANSSTGDFKGLLNELRERSSVPEATERRDYLENGINALKNAGRTGEDRSVAEDQRIADKMKLDSLNRELQEANQNISRIEESEGAARKQAETLAKLKEEYIGMIGPEQVYRDAGARAQINMELVRQAKPGSDIENSLEMGLSKPVIENYKTLLEQLRPYNPGERPPEISTERREEIRTGIGEATEEEKGVLSNENKRTAYEMKVVQNAYETAKMASPTPGYLVNSLLPNSKIAESYAKKEESDWSNNLK